MKKILIGACAAMTLLAASCDKCASDKCAAVTAATDSTSVAYGNFVGTFLLQDYTRFESHQASDKENFLKGVQTAMGIADDKNTLMGLQVGAQILGELKGLQEQSGVELDKAKVLEAFKKAFLQDSVGMSSVETANLEFRRLLNKTQEEIAAAEKAKVEETEATAVNNDAAANGKAAQEYVEKAKAEDASIASLPSGLSYKILEPGTGDKPAADATVVVNYTGRHLNGEVFDSSEGRGPATFNLQGVVPGFSEGLQQIAKGGKATLYIPGNLAYGEQGAPAANIGPNEMLIFDVELVDIK